MKVLGRGKRIFKKIKNKIWNPVRIWEGQKVFDHIYDLLTKANFQLIDYELLEDGNQADSFWIAKEHVSCKIYSITDGGWRDLTKPAHQPRK